MTEETRWAFCNTKIIPKHLLIWMCFLRLLLAIWNVNCFVFFGTPCIIIIILFSICEQAYILCHVSIISIGSVHLKKKILSFTDWFKLVWVFFFSFLSVRKNLKNVASQKIMIVIFSKCVPILSWINFELGL